MTVSPDNEREDFLLLEMRNGYPVLRVNHGSGEARLSVDGRDSQGRLRLRKLSDGKWHRIDVFINGQVFCHHLTFVHAMDVLVAILHDFFSAVVLKKVSISSNDIRPNNSVLGTIMLN